MTQQSPPSTQDDFLAVQFPVGLTETGTNVCAVVQPRVLVHAFVWAQVRGVPAFSLISSPPVPG